jgi:hypothetical protein
LEKKKLSGELRENQSVGPVRCAEDLGQERERPVPVNPLQLTTF